MSFSGMRQKAILLGMLLLFCGILLYACAETPQKKTLGGAGAAGESGLVAGFVSKLWPQSQRRAVSGLISPHLGQIMAFLLERAALCEAQDSSRFLSRTVWLDSESP